MDEGAVNTKEPGETSPRKVSFPDQNLVTGYVEPKKGLVSRMGVTNQEILSQYIVSCERHNSAIIPSVCDQIKQLDIKSNERCPLFTLMNIDFSSYCVEPLEEIFKRIQFNKIEIISCTFRLEAFYSLIEILNFYDSLEELTIVSNLRLNSREWESFGVYLNETLSMKKLYLTNIFETKAQLDKCFKYFMIPQNLTHLTIQRCNIHGHGLSTLSELLVMSSCRVKELCLADNRLTAEDALLIGGVLKMTRTLEVLDLSNNEIGDIGFDHVTTGIAYNVFTCPLKVLVLWQNLLTSHISINFGKLVTSTNCLTILNLGRNMLGDLFIKFASVYLIKSQFTDIGLQLCFINYHGVVELANILVNNEHIQRVDLRGNDFGEEGLCALHKAVVLSSSLLEIDITETFYQDNDFSTSLLKDIRHKCLENKKKCLKASRRFSLTGQHSLYESLKLSSFSEKYQKNPNRFQIVRVSEVKTTDDVQSMAKVEESTSAMSDNDVKTVTDIAKEPSETVNEQYLQMQQTDSTLACLMDISLDRDNVDQTVELVNDGNNTLKSNPNYKRSLSLVKKLFESNIGNKVEDNESFKENISPQQHLLDTSIKKRIKSEVNEKQLVDLDYITNDDAMFPNLNNENSVSGCSYTNINVLNSDNANFVVDYHRQMIDEYEDCASKMQIDISDEPGKEEIEPESTENENPDETENETIEETEKQQTEDDESELAESIEDEPTAIGNDTEDEQTENKIEWEEIALIDWKDGKSEIIDVSTSSKEEEEEEEGNSCDNDNDDGDDDGSEENIINLEDNNEDN